MTRYAVLLRAVNLGARNRVPMPAWRARLTALGYDDVRTHLASGQAVLTSRASPGRVAAAVRQDLLDSGVDTPVLVRTLAQFREVVAACPWPEQAAAAPTTVHAVFVDVPVERPWWRTEPDRYAPEHAVDGPGCCYLLFPDGAGRSRMPGPRGVATARNWRTVLALQALLAT